MTYNKEKLIKWIQINVPSLQSLERYKQRSDKQREIEMFNKLMQDRRREKSFLHDSIKRQMVEYHDEYSSANFNPLDDAAASTPNMKQVGKSMFIINNRDDSPDMPLRGAGPLDVASSLKDRIASCVE